VALQEFTTTCPEYSIGVNSSLADQLHAYVRRTSDNDRWVRHVADQFVLADQGSASSTGRVMGPLDRGDSVAQWDAATKLEAAIERAVGKLPAALADQLRAMLTPENIAALAIILAAWAASHALGIGEVVDLILAVGGVVMLGPEAIRAVQELASFATGALGAKSNADLDNAGDHLAEAVAIVGVDGAMVLLTHRAGGKLGDRVPRVNTRPAEVVTPEGLRLNIGPVDDSLPQTAAMSTPEPGGVGPANAGVDVRATPEEVRAWADGLETLPTPTNSARDLYEVAKTGDRNYVVPAGDETIATDGVRATDAHLLEAKYVDNPARSPFIDDSACPDFVRENVRAKVDDEFRRYAAALKDARNPVDQLAVIINDERAAPYFEALLSKYHIQGHIEIRP